MACSQGSKGGVRMRTLFTRKEAAARLNISLVTLDEERQGGYLAYIQRKPGGRVWIAEDACQRRNFFARKRRSEMTHIAGHSTAGISAGGTV